MEPPRRVTGTWARALTLVALTFSAIISVVYFLNPVWEFSNAVEAFSGGSGDGSALFLLYFLAVVALILDLVAVGLIFAFVKKTTDART